MTSRANIFAEVRMSDLLNVGVSVIADLMEHNAETTASFRMQGCLPKRTRSP